MAETLCAYIEGGQVRKMITTITGLTHLEGEEIQVQVDGGLPEGENAFTVSGGQITLPNKAAVVHAGLPYDGTIKLLKKSGGSPIGTGQSKMRRVFITWLRLHRTLGLKIGVDEDHLDPLFDEDQTTLFTGDQSKLPNTTWNKNPEIIIRQDQPLPAQVLAAITRSEVEEKL